LAWGFAAVAGLAVAAGLAAGVAGAAGVADGIANAGGAADGAATGAGDGLRGAVANASAGAGGLGGFAGASACAGGCAGAAGGSMSGRMPANSDNARCSLGVINFTTPLSSCLMPRVSMMTITAPTMARRELTARISTAERESPRSKARTGGAAMFEKVSSASLTALCSSGPIELSLSHKTSPCSSCNETACARAGSMAARTF
jgi:hypothetical protein